jgi:glycosyltransferase involved in cell wall biosynthesis
MDSWPGDSVTALMPVHAGIRPDDLAAAVDSVLEQTVPVDEFVVVEDGPLTAGLSAVLDAAEGRHGQMVRVRLPVNAGAGVANQAGLAVAHGAWIMKVDADDINLPHRVEKQLALCAQGGVDVCGAAMLEFDVDPEHPLAIRRSPGSMIEIRKRVRFNNPMNHPTTFYRRELALQAGGYPTMRFMQDYDLFARLLVNGAEMFNLDEPLVKFRGGTQMRRRRRGGEILRLEWELQRRLRTYGLIGWPFTLRNLAVRVGFRLLPDSASRLVYGRVLSRPVVTTSEERS